MMNSIQPDALASLLANGEAKDRMPTREGQGDSGDPSCGETVDAGAGMHGVVGGRTAGSCSDVNQGSRSGKRTGNQANSPEEGPEGDRAPVGAKKSRNGDGAKGGREANPEGNRQSEEEPPSVPAADKQGGKDLWQRHKAERGVWSQGMLETLERGVKGGKWFSLIDKVYQEKTLAIGWGKVKSNDGSCGVDGVTVKRFERESQERLQAMNAQLKEGDYRSLPAKRKWLAKPGSKEKRPLGIPAVCDRVVQTAAKLVMEPIFEKEFAPQSYGFRPELGCKDALRRVEELLKSGHWHVVDIDIKKFFDTIPHDLLMKLVEERIADGRLLELVEKFLKAGVMEGMDHWDTEEGTPQGGVISPLLANIYLNPLDWLMVGLGIQLVRYADDMVAMCRDEESARKALEEIGRWMGESKLTLHPEKTRVVDMTVGGNHFDFLGYRFWRSRKGGIARLVRPKSMKKLKDGLKPLTKRANGQSMEAIVKRINPVLKGWYGYFKHASAATLGRLDGWLRGRLRSILRKRRGGKGRGRGIDHHRWPNRYFDTLGAYCLKHAQRMEMTSLRNGANC
jgi:RNA-directed DNA polymerase